LDTTSHRYAEHCLSFAEAAGDGLCSADELLWTRRVEVEIDNLRAGLSWAINTGTVDTALRLIAAFELPGFRWGEPFGALAEQAATLPGADGHPLLAIALASAAFNALNRDGDSAHAQNFANAAFDVAELVPGAAGAYVRSTVPGQLASVRSYLGDWEGLRQVAAMGVAAARESGEARRLAWAFLSAPVLGRDGRDAVAMAEEGLGYAREAGSPTLLAFSLMILGNFLSGIDPDRAEAALDESMAYSSQVGNEYTAAMARIGIANLQNSRGDVSTAVKTLMEGAAQADAAGLPYVVRMCLATLAGVLAGSDDQGAQLILAWCGQQGMSFVRADFSIPNWSQVDLHELDGREEGETRARLADEVAGLNEAGMISLLERRLASP
jgi:hypothetical protein